MLSRCITIILLNSLVFGKEINLVIGDELPPYIFKNSSKGIEFEIVKEALEFKGHQLVPTYVPLARLLRQLRNPRADGALTINKNFDTKGMYLSAPYITYHNVLISLHRKKQKFNTISDIRDKSILAFQNSRKYLGSKYSNATNTCRYFKEMNNQRSQVAILLKDRVDAIVIDKNIFLYHYRNFKREIRSDVKLHHVFDPSQYQVLFKDEKIRDDFNQGLRYLKDTGRYDDILKKYTK